MRVKRQLAEGVLSACLVLPAMARDLRDPVGTVNAFHDALQSGDEALAKSLLAPDVLIYESGGQESSLQEYAAHLCRPT